MTETHSSSESDAATEEEFEGGTTESFLEFWNLLGENILNQTNPAKLREFVERANTTASHHVIIDVHPTESDTLSSYLELCVSIEQDSVALDNCTAGDSE